MFHAINICKISERENVGITSCVFCKFMILSLKINQTFTQHALVIGGCTQAKERGCLSTTEMIKVSLNEHKQVSITVERLSSTHLIVPRRGAIAWLCDKKVHVYGGCADGGQQLSSLEGASVEGLSHLGLVIY
jgi:hypothetical protein